MQSVGIYNPPAAKPAAAVVNNPASGASFDPELNETDLEVTASAVAKLSEIIAQADEDIAGVRIYIGGGGCSGMSYGMTFTDSITEFDYTRTFDGLKILVDAVAVNYLRGAQIDYIQEVGRERFVFNNVFASTGGSGTCGGCSSAGG